MTKIMAETSGFEHQPGKRFTWSPEHSTRFYWILAIWGAPNMHSTTRYVLLGLATYFKPHCKDGAWPSYIVLAEKTGLSKTSIRKHLEKAAKSGWVLIEVRKNRNEHRTHLYYPAAPEGFDPSKLVEKQSDTGVTNPDIGMTDPVTGMTDPEIIVTDPDTGEPIVDTGVLDMGTEYSNEGSNEDSKEVGNDDDPSDPVALASNDSHCNNNSGTNSKTSLWLKKAEALLIANSGKPLSDTDRKVMEVSLFTLLLEDLPSSFPNLPDKDIEAFLEYVGSLQDPVPRNFSIKTFRKFYWERDRAEKDKRRGQKDSRSRPREGQSYEEFQVEERLRAYQKNADITEALGKAHICDLWVKVAEALGEEETQKQFGECPAYPLGSKERFSPVNEVIVQQMYIWRPAFSKLYGDFAPEELVDPMELNLTEDEYEMLKELWPLDQKLIEDVFKKNLGAPPEFPLEYWDRNEDVLVKLGHQQTERMKQRREKREQERAEEERQKTKEEEEKTISEKRHKYEEKLTDRAFSLMEDKLNASDKIGPDEWLDEDEVLERYQKMYPDSTLDDVEDQIRQSDIEKGLEIAEVCVNNQKQ